MAIPKPALISSLDAAKTFAAGKTVPERAGVGRRLRTWIDTAAAVDRNDARADRIDWLRIAPFLAMHLACACVAWVGVSPIALCVAVALYCIRMFALTAFYHRYFSHRTFRTSRAAQFIFALLGASCVQCGPLWWAAHHRNHHRNADTALDPHSPNLCGLMWSHAGWFMTPRNFGTDLARVPDLAKYPELRLVDRFDSVVPVALAAALYALGAVLQHAAPRLGTSGAQMLIWGFFVSTVVLFHATVTINSLAHRFGSRRYDTPDNSRNNVWLALLTFGEGWHNNHHFFPGSSRQGFHWWEVDITWYGLQVMAALGLIRGLKPVPARVYDRARK